MRGCDARLGFYEHLEKVSSGTRAEQGRIKPVSAVFAITRVMSQMQTVFNFMILQQEQFTGGIARPVKTVAVPFPSSLSLPLFLSLASKFVANCANKHKILGAIFVYGKESTTNRPTAC